MTPPVGTSFRKGMGPSTPRMNAWTTTVSTPPTLASPVTRTMRTDTVRGTPWRRSQLTPGESSAASSSEMITGVTTSPSIPSPRVTR